MLGHKRIQPRHNWKDKSGHENIFTGLVFCENGHKLSFCPQQKDDVNLDHYKCHYYYRVGDTCSGSHYLRKEILQELILNEFQQLVSAIHFDEEKLLEELKSRFDIRENKKQNSLQKQLKQAQNVTQRLT